MIRWTPELDAEVIRRRDLEHMTFVQVGAALGLDHTTVLYALKSGPLGAPIAGETPSIASERPPMIEATLICHMGSDLDVVNCARVSFAKASKNFDGRDARLIAFLAEHNHWAPFSHPQASFHVKAPIFVRAQCFKHKVGFAESEVSRRYVDDLPEVYDPGNWRTRATDKKQGSGKGIVATPAVFQAYEEAVARALDAYAVMISLGVAPEQARMVLPVATMTEWRWTGSLAAWARFCHLRLAPDAQEETRQLAQLIASQMADLFPISWAALAGWRPAEDAAA